MKTVIVVAIALGSAALLWMAGFWLGQQMPWEGENGFYDLRKLPRLLASLGFGAAGFAAGGVLGAWLGKKLAEHPQVGIPAAAILLFAPLLLSIWRQSRMQRSLDELRAEQQERGRLESARQIAAQKAWVNSPQYVERTEQQLSKAEHFKAVMGPIAYPGSQLAAQPFPLRLEFHTADSFEVAAARLKQLPITMGAKVGSPKQLLAYFELQGFKGSIRLKAAADGSLIVYDLE